MNEFIKKMLQLGAELEKTESPMQASMIINDAEILYRDEIKALTIPVVSNRRELLIAFKDHISELTMSLDSYTDKDILDGFESNL